MLGLGREYALFLSKSLNILTLGDQAYSWKVTYESKT